MSIQVQTEVLSSDAHADAYGREAIQMPAVPCHLREPIQLEQAQAHPPGETV